MVELPKGGNTSVVGPPIRSTLQTRVAPGDIEICALLVDEQRKARSDEDFVFFNHERSRCGSTRRRSPVDVEINLERVPDRSGRDRHRRRPRRHCHRLGCRPRRRQCHGPSAHPRSPTPSPASRQSGA